MSMWRCIAVGRCRSRYGTICPEAIDSEGALCWTEEGGFLDRVRQEDVCDDCDDDGQDALKYLYNRETIGQSDSLRTEAPEADQLTKIHLHPWSMVLLTGPIALKP